MKSENSALIIPSNTIAPNLRPLGYSHQHMLSVRKLQVLTLSLRNYGILGKPLSFSGLPHVIC